MILYRNRTKVNGWGGDLVGTIQKPRRWRFNVQRLPNGVFFQIPFGWSLFMPWRIRGTG
jgi:hypothetical protein